MSRRYDKHFEQQGISIMNDESYFSFSKILIFRLVVKQREQIWENSWRALESKLAFPSQWTSRSNLFLWIKLSFRPAEKLINEMFWDWNSAQGGNLQIGISYLSARFSSCLLISLRNHKATKELYRLVISSLMETNVCQMDNRVFMALAWESLLNGRENDPGS